MGGEFTEHVGITRFSLVENLKQNILISSGAKNVWIKQNRSCEDTEGIEPCSISIFVEGGHLEKIYRAIELHRPIGISTNGDVDIRGERFYWVVDIDYKEQQNLVKKINRKLHKEELLKQLAELEEDDE